MDKAEILRKVEQWIRQEVDLWAPLLAKERDPFAHQQTLQDVLSRGTAAELADILRRTAYQTQGDFPLVVTSESVEKQLVLLMLNCVSDEKNQAVNDFRLKQALEQVDYSLGFQPHPDRAWAYLHQFGCLERTLDLDGPLRIRRCTVFEAAAFEEQSQSVGKRTWCEFIVETVPGTELVVVEDGGATLAGDVLEAFGTVVTALRMTSPSSVGLNLVINEIRTVNKKTTDSPMVLTYIPPPEVFPAAFSHFVNTQCILDKHELELLRRLHRGLRGLIRGGGEKADRALRALRRYNTAICSDQFEDMVVDAIIGLEILFKTTGFRMAFLASHLAAIGHIERKNVVELLDRSYDLRSRIVHGGTIRESASPLTGKLLTIFCRVLRSYVHVGLKESDVVDYIKRIAYDPQELTRLEGELAQWSRAETSWVWKPSELIQAN